MGTGSFPGVRCGRDVTLTPHPLIVQRSKIELGYTSTLPRGFRGLWKGETYLSLFLRQLVSGAVGDTPQMMRTEWCCMILAVSPFHTGNFFNTLAEWVSRSSGVSSFSDVAFFIVLLLLRQSLLLLTEIVIEFCVKISRCTAAVVRNEPNYRRTLKTS